MPFTQEGKHSLCSVRKPPRLMGRRYSQAEVLDQMLAIKWTLLKAAVLVAGVKTRRQIK